MAAPVLICVESVIALFIVRESVPIKLVAIMVTSAACLYVATFAVHFALLPLTGDGDVFMPPKFQEDLIHSPFHDVRVCDVSIGVPTVLSFLRVYLLLLPWLMVCV